MGCAWNKNTPRSTNLQVVLSLRIPGDFALLACLLLKPCAPCFSSDYFSLAWKDFG